MMTCFTPMQTCNFRPGLKMGVKIAFSWGSGCGEPGGTPPPRISRSIYNCLKLTVVLFSDLLILFYLDLNQLAQFLPR